MLLRSCSPTLALRSRLARAGALLVLCAMLTTTTGCFGTFPVTRTIYRENQEISHVEFHQTLAYWVMILTLVYPGAILTDAIVMNTIEFWNPEPTSWEASGGYLTAPGADLPAASPSATAAATSRSSRPSAWPEKLPASASTESTVRWMEATPEPAGEPIAAAPGADRPALPASEIPSLAPGTALPTVPLPLPPLEPIHETSSAASASLVPAPGA